MSKMYNEIISYIMAKNNLSQEGMAKILGVNQTTVGAVAEREEETRLRQYFAAVRKVRRYAKRIIRDRLNRELQEAEKSAFLFIKKRHWIDFSAVPVV